MFLSLKINKIFKNTHTPDHRCFPAHQLFTEAGSVFQKGEQISSVTCWCVAGVLGQEGLSGSVCVGTPEPVQTHRFEDGKASPAMELGSHRVSGL